MGGGQQPDAPDLGGRVTGEDRFAMDRVTPSELAAAPVAGKAYRLGLRHPSIQRVTPDVIVVADSGNWDERTPGLTVSLRGLEAFGRHGVYDAERERQAAEAAA